MPDARAGIKVRASPSSGRQPARVWHEFAAPIIAPCDGPGRPERGIARISHSVFSMCSNWRPAPADACPFANRFEGCGAFGIVGEASLPEAALHAHCVHLRHLTDFSFGGASDLKRGPAPTSLALASRAALIPPGVSPARGCT